jgi:transposase-like protein
MSGMKTTVTCPECGAVYERTEEKVPFRDHDTFECRFCGRTLEEWNGSRIPVFRTVKEPEGTPSSV